MILSPFLVTRMKCISKLTTALSFQSLMLISTSTTGTSGFTTPPIIPFYIPKKSSESKVTTTSTSTKTYSTSSPSSRIKKYSPRDYSLSPTPSSKELSELTIGQRIVAIGDVHGDLHALKNFLETAQVLDLDESWIGGSTILVQCGDVLDRGEEECACLKLLAKLSHEAHEAGGSVICLLGNHEVLNIQGQFQYAFPRGNEEFNDIFGDYLDSRESANWKALVYANHEPIRWNVCEPGTGILAKESFANMKVAVMVGRSIFVHAGLTTEHLNYYNNSLDSMNDAATDWITTIHYENPQELPTTVNQVLQQAQARMNATISTTPYCLGGTIGSTSPIWMRDYSKPSNSPPSNKNAQQMIDSTLSKLNAQRMIMGHTPQSNINTALGGKAWRIDVGASRGVMGNTEEVLEIIHGESEDEVFILRKREGSQDVSRISAFDRVIHDVLM